MTATVTELIRDTPAILAAIASLYAVRKVQQVHISINSRFDQWMEATKKSSYAEGMLEGKKNRPKR